MMHGSPCWDTLQRALRRLKAKTEEKQFVLAFLNFSPDSKPLVQYLEQQLQAKFLTTVFSLKINAADNLFGHCIICFYLTRNDVPVRHLQKSYLDKLPFTHRSSKRAQVYVLTHGCRCNKVWHAK